MQAESTQTLELKETAANDDLYRRSNLTRMQMLYWTGYQLRPDVPLYAAPLVFTLPLAIDAALLKTAVQSVIDQSDALRTVLRIENGAPRQFVQPQFEAPLLYRDFSGEENPKQQANDWLLQVAQTPFEASKSLVQFALARVNAESYDWLLNQHHIIADATSAFYIYRAVARAYEQLLHPHEPLEPIPLYPFETYLNLERDYRVSPQFQRGEQFWQQKLDKNVEPLFFFGKKGSKKGTHIKRVEFALDAERTAQISALAAQPEFRDLTMELTMFNLLSALFFALVYHLTGNERLTFLSPMHNRPTQAFRQTIGLLMEICPFAVDVAADESFASLVQKLKYQTRGAMRFSQHGSSVSLKNKAHDLMFNYHTRPLLTFDGQVIEQKQLSVGHSTETFALHVHEFEGTGKLLFKFDFHKDIFTDAEQETAVAVFQALLDAFLADPTQPLKEVKLPWTVLDTAVTTPLDTKAQNYIAPRDRLELNLIELWENVLGVANIGIYDNYFDLGGTSWQAMNLFAEIEKLTGHYLPLSTLVQSGTVAELADVLRTQSGSDPWPLLVNLQTGDLGSLPLFLIHGGGGHVLIFNKLTKYLPADIPIFAFQARGMDGKTPPFESVETMAALYVEALLQHQPEGPYRLAGYSMGGAIVLEMAQQLCAKGREVSFLGIIDTPAQNPNLIWIRRGTRLAARILRLTPQQEKKLFIKNRHRLWVGMRQNLINRKNRIVHRFKPPQPVVNSYKKDQEDIRIQQINAANTLAFYTYIPKRYPGKVTLFKSMEGYRDIYRATKDPLMGWQRVTRDLDMHLVEGNHNQIMIEPYVQTLANAFMRALGIKP